MNVAVSSPDPISVVEPAPVASRVPNGDIGAAPASDDLFALMLIVAQQVHPVQAVTLWQPGIERGIHGLAPAAGRGNAWPGEARSLLRVTQLVSGLNGRELAFILGRSLTEVSQWLDREQMPNDVHAKVEQLWLAVRANDRGTALGNRLALGRACDDGRDGIAVAAAGEWAALAALLHFAEVRPTPLPLPLAAGTPGGRESRARAGDAILGLISGAATDPPGRRIGKPIRR